MTKLSQKITKLEEIISTQKIQTISFDIDGTIYPIAKVQLRWWKKFLLNNSQARRFYAIKKNWEVRRQGNFTDKVSSDDVVFYEKFLIDMLDPSLVPPEMSAWMNNLEARGIKLYFLSDHGAQAKLLKLNLSNHCAAINCLGETGELKPHHMISRLLKEIYHLDPQNHLHLGDRWTDEEQAKLFGCHFHYLKT